MSKYLVFTIGELNVLLASAQNDHVIAQAPTFKLHDYGKRGTSTVEEADAFAKLALGLK